MSSNRIRTLNDQCRQAWGVYPNSRVVITEGIRALSAADQSAIAEKVQAFDCFGEDNDPHGEHDFGSFEQNGQRVFWKIDYYDPTCRYGSEDPSNPARTCRVLTIMLADEY
ncbi:MAG: DUF3768 domain-containing protein [Rhodomicrobium sp.]